VLGYGHKRAGPSARGILINVPRAQPVNASQLERWLGPEAFRGLQLSTRDWYGPPIAVAGVPGAVYAGRDGTFVGSLRAGGEVTAREMFEGVLRKIRSTMRNAAARQRFQLNAGFTSLGDIVSEAAAGKKREFFFAKTTTTVTTAGRHSSHWQLSGIPGLGTVPSAAPGGNAPTDATAGAFPFVNPTGGDTQHLVAGMTLYGQQGTLLLYDRLFHVAKTASSSATEAVTGVPTRYQSTTPGAADYAGGNFCWVEVGLTALGAVAHNWTVCQYTDQDNNAAQSFASMTGVSSSAVHTLDHVAGGNWFLEPASGDTGVKALTQMQASVATVTGLANFVIGHPIAFMPCALANFTTLFNFISTSLNLERIFDDAALAVADLWRVGATGAAYNLKATTVAG